MEEQPTINQGAAAQPNRLQRFKQNKNAKLGVIVAAAVVALGAGSAAAYYGVIVPNQPENLLKKSVENTLKLDKLSGSGKLEFSSKETDNKSVIVDYSLKGDNNSNTSEITLEGAYSGVKLPIEMRSVDKDLYVKVGDLGSIKSVAELAQPGSGALVDTIGEKIANQWIEIDESLIKQAVKEDSCDLSSLKLSDQDIEQIMKIYGDNAFATIKNSSDEDVNGVATKKLDLGLDQSKAKSFGNELKNTEIYKKIDACSDVDEANKEADDAADDFKGTANFSVWVDKGSKQIAKIALDVSEEGEGTFKMDFTVNDDEINITKPENAKPALELFAELGPLFGGVLGGDLGAGAAMPTDMPAANSGGDGISAQCMAAFQVAATTGDLSALPPECQALTN